MQLLISDFFYRPPQNATTKFVGKILEKPAIAFEATAFKEAFSSLFKSRNNFFYFCASSESDLSTLKNMLYTSFPPSLKITFCPGGGGVLLGIFGGSVSPTSPNPDPISDQKMAFPTPVFRPGLKNPYPFSDLASKIHTRFQT